MKKLALIATISSLLVACGSSSNGNPTNPKSQTNKTAKEYHFSNDVGMKTTTSKNVNLSGILTYQGFGKKEEKNFSISDDAKTIKINGETINIDDNQDIEKEILSDNVFLVSWDKEESKEAMKDENHAHKYVDFIVGKPTTDMPTSGSAIYKVHQTEVPENVGELNVSFAKKTIEGSIDDTPLKANIFGNQFSGKKVLKGENGKTYFETYLMGTFYGKKASEIAGFYGASKSQNNEFIQGRAFYGKKQK